MPSRVGTGYDSHRLVEGERLVIGGVEIDHDRGLTGHSDADVLIHAVIDALLGACALGDLGQLFPPDEEEWRDADSIATMAGAVCAGLGGPEVVPSGWVRDVEQASRLDLRPVASALAGAAAEIIAHDLAEADGHRARVSALLSPETVAPGTAVPETVGAGA